MGRDDCRFRPGTKTTNHKDTLHLESRSRKLDLTDRRHHAVKTGKAYVDYSGLQGRISEQAHVRACVCVCVCFGSFGDLTHSFRLPPACVQNDPQDLKYRPGFAAYYIGNNL